MAPKKSAKIVAELPPENLIETPVEEELKTAYLNYAMSVIVSRALPDARDGLKPSQRRILVAMADLGLSPTSKFRKCAKIAGDASGNYHPHGEQVIYPTLVRMAQDFATRYKLVEGQGNFGSIDGDPPAAMRYTEARLSPYAALMLEDIDLDTVDFVPNYDETRTEPTVLPAKFPNLICNGTTGIAVGMATSIPPHNLAEVVDALVNMIENPDASLEDLLKFIKGPDFPTGGIICGVNKIKEAYITGRQTITILARIQQEKARDKKYLVITEIPFNRTKSEIIEQIAEKVKEGEIEGITDIRDESDKSGIRVVIEIDQGIDPEIVLNQLYRKTLLRDSFSIILLALVQSRPKLMNLKELLQVYLEHRKEVVIRRTRLLLKNASQEAHILEGLLKAVSIVGELINTIRKATDPQEAKTILIEKYEFSQQQAEAILRLTLQRLTKLETEKINTDLQKLKKDIENYEAILADEKRVWDIIKNELIQMKEKFADKRRTEILEKEPEEFEKEELIPEQEVVVILTEQGYIKRVPLEPYRYQKPPARAVASHDVREDDKVIAIFAGSTLDYALFFSDKGKMYWCKLHEIPSLARSSRGKLITTLFKLAEDEKITTAICIKNFQERNLLLLTRNGIVKKGDLSEYHTSLRFAGVKVIDLDIDDKVAGAFITSGRDEVIIASANANAVRFVEDKVRVMGRAASGVKGIKLEPTDSAVSVSGIKRATDVFTLTSMGFGKRSYVHEFRRTSRGATGVCAAKLTERTGKLVALKCVKETDEIIIATKKGAIAKIRAFEIEIGRRYTAGQKLVELDEGDEVQSVWFIRR